MADSKIVYNKQIAHVSSVEINTGPQGEKGNTGDQGPQGDIGPRGKDGGPGQRGLKGDPGPTGAMGYEGIQGPLGETGDKGDQGIQGIQGIKGDKGDPGTDGADGEAVDHLGLQNVGVNTHAQIDAHIADTGDANPHGLTPAGIGAAAVDHTHQVAETIIIALSPEKGEAVVDQYAWNMPLPWNFMITGFYIAAAEWYTGTGDVTVDFIADDSNGTTIYATITSGSNSYDQNPPAMGAPLEVFKGNDFWISTVTVGVPGVVGLKAIIEGYRT